MLGVLVPAPWTTGGLLQVKQISLKRDSLRIDGQRVLVALRSGKLSSSSPSLAAVLTERSVRIILDLDPTSVDDKEIGVVLRQIFEPTDIQLRIATYWVPAITAGPDVQSSETGKVVGTLEGARPVYKPSPGIVEPPKSLRTPDPDYTEDARKKHLQGTTELMVVINEKGLPEILEVVRGLGEGLDVKALEAISEWRFEPATYKGEPVAVMISVQMKFALY
jgi:TonB family protein